LNISIQKFRSNFRDLKEDVAMDSKQSVSSGPIVIGTSIGPVRIVLEGHDYFSMGTPNAASPDIFIALTRCDDRDEEWQVDGKPRYYNEKAEKVPMPPTLIGELIALGIEWAKGHPEEFEREVADEFDDGLSHATHYLLDQVLETLKETKDALTELLAGEDAFGEFALQAPPELREVVENAAKMFHAMGLQADAAAEAIREAATAFTGRRITRPGTEEA
jgi:hypothetical protein